MQPPARMDCRDFYSTGRGPKCSGSAFQLAGHAAGGGTCSEGIILAGKMDS